MRTGRIKWLSGVFATDESSPIREKSVKLQTLLLLKHSSSFSLVSAAMIFC